MTPDSILITLLYAVACLALIGTLNARGTARVVTACLLTLFCFGAAVFHTTRHFAQARAEADALPSAPADSFAHGSASAPIPVNGGDAGTPWNDGEPADIAASLQSLRTSLSGEEPAKAHLLSDSGYQIFEARADSYSARAKDLRERAVRLSGDAPAGQEQTVELLNAAASSLALGAYELKLFFHSENRDEEKQHLAGFQQGLQASEAPLRQAQARLGASPGAPVSAPAP